MHRTTEGCLLPRLHDSDEIGRVSGVVGLRVAGLPVAPLLDRVPPFSLLQGLARVSSVSAEIELVHRVDVVFLVQVNQLACHFLLLALVCDVELDVHVEIFDAVVRVLGLLGRVACLLVRRDSCCGLG